MVGAVLAVPLGWCHPAQSGQTPQAFSASHLLGWWFSPSGRRAGFCRAQGDATIRCDGMENEVGSV